MWSWEELFLRWVDSVLRGPDSHLQSTAMMTTCSTSAIDPAGSDAIARWENEGGLALAVETPGAPLLPSPAPRPDPTSLSAHRRSVDAPGRGVNDDDVPDAVIDERNGTSCL
jgi:hypothetical protein